MNKENNPAPRCPYCGSKMRHKQSLVCRWGEEAVDVMVMLHWYECTNEECESESPTGRTAEEAYKAALKRDEEPNKILSLYNICSKECFVEWHDEAAIPYSIGGNIPIGGGRRLLFVFDIIAGRNCTRLTLTKIHIFAVLLTGLCSIAARLVICTKSIIATVINITVQFS